jgi:dCTP deaminase
LVLSDRTIREEIAKGRLVIEPLEDGCIQPASVDLHLDKQILVYRNASRPYVDVRQPTADLATRVEVSDKDPFLVQPGEFFLVSTLEHIELPGDIAGRLEGKSSLARIGLLVHSTAGFVDPGWKGKLTMQMTNVSRLPVTIYAGMRIAQISFLRLTTPAERPYGSSGLGSKYQGQQEPTASRYHENFRKDA